MRKSTRFLKWLLLTSIYAVLAFVAESRAGAISYLINNDVSYICVALPIIFGMGSLRALHQVMNGCNDFSLLNYFAEISTILGLGGSVFGLLLLFSDGLVEAESIMQGLGTAMTTTLMGIIVSLCLSVYPQVLKSRECEELE